MVARECVSVNPFQSCLGSWPLTLTQPDRCPIPSFASLESSEHHAVELEYVELEYDRFLALVASVLRLSTIRQLKQVQLPVSILD